MNKLFLIAFCLLNWGCTQKKNPNPTEESMYGKPVVIPIPQSNSTLELNIVKSESNNNPQEMYFAGIVECPKSESKFDLQVDNIGKCLKFSTQFSGEPWSYVPIQIIDSFEEKMMKTDLDRIYTSHKTHSFGDKPMEVKQDRKDTFTWGSVFHWMTLSTGSSHYMYLVPHNKKIAVRIGPIAGLVLVQHELNFDQASWK